MTNQPGARPGPAGRPSLDLRGVVDLGALARPPASAAGGRASNGTGAGPGTAPAGAFVKDVTDGDFATEVIEVSNTVPVVLDFWATWCGPCVSEFDELIEQNLRFRQRGFEMVTVAAQFPDEEAKVLKFLQDKHASTRNLIFGDADKYALIEAFDKDWNGELPYTLLIGTDGKVLYRESGSIDFLAIRRVIVPALDLVTPWGNKDKSYDR